MAEEAQFGKYKGRPVEDLLADGTYMQWLEGQPWFREKYGHILQMRDAEAASRTPVHNRMQARFLEADYAMAFVAAANPVAVKNLGEEAASRHSANVSEETKPVNLEKLRSQVPSPKVAAFFEQKSADVYLVYYWYHEALPIRSPDDAVVYYNLSRRAAHFRIEIKPTVGDEYPAVLRQMLRNQSWYLYVGRYLGEGATREQFVGIFAASGIKVVFQADVEVALAKGETS